MACAGNANEKCGAGNILSVYNTGNLTVYQAPASQSTGLPGNWVYQGCYSDNVNNNRALFWQSILTSNNSATTCLNLCAQYGYEAAGTEVIIQVFYFIAVLSGYCVFQRRSKCIVFRPPLWPSSLLGILLLERKGASFRHSLI